MMGPIVVPASWPPLPLLPEDGVEPDREPPDEPDDGAVDPVEGDEPLVDPPRSTPPEDEPEDPLVPTLP
jgi:hypothetical protein